MSWLYLIRYLAAFAFLMGLMGLMAWALRTYGSRLGLTVGPTPDQRRMKRVESMALSARQTLHLIEVDGVPYLATTSPEGTTLTPHLLPSTPKKK